MIQRISRPLWKIAKITLALAVVSIIVILLLLTNSTTATMVWPYIQKIEPCYVPPGVSIDSAIVADVFAFEDLNGNGLQENNEPPLTGVIMAIDHSGMGYNEELFSGLDAADESVKQTDQNGRAHLSKFIAGFACNDSIDTKIFAQIPKGYRPTTPIILDVGNQKIYTFGFIRNP